MPVYDVILPNSEHICYVDVSETGIIYRECTCLRELHLKKFNEIIAWKKKNKAIIKLYTNKKTA